VGVKNCRYDKGTGNREQGTGNTRRGFGIFFFSLHISVFFCSPTYIYSIVNHVTPLWKEEIENMAGVTGLQIKSQFCA
jgi:hypothetical protein